MPQVLAMSDIMAGTTLEDLEYSDDGDDLESDEEDIDKVQQCNYIISCKLACYDIPISVHIISGAHDYAM